MLVDDIRTERLVLRSTREEWGGLCVDFWLDGEINKYLSDPPREKAGAKYLHFAEGIERDPSWYPFVAFHKIKIKVKAMTIGKLEPLPAHAAQSPSRGTAGIWGTASTRAFGGRATAQRWSGA